MTTDNIFSEDAELAILSIILKNPDYVYGLSEIKSEMFSSDRGKILFSSLGGLLEQDLIPEKTLLLEHLRSNNKLDTIGGEDYLSHLYELSFNNKNFDEYKKILVRAYKAKNLLSLSAEIPKLISGKTVNVDSIISNIKNRLERLSTSTGRGGTFRLSELLPDAMKNIKHKTENPGLAGVSTGFDIIDNITGGFKGGELWMIGGRPGMGKTSFACNSILKSAKDDGIPLIFSLEMTDQVLIERLGALESTIESNRINLGLMNDEEMEKLKEAWLRLEPLPIYLDSDFLVTVEYIEAIIRKFKAQADVNTVWIDYIQLLAERTAESTHELGRISRAMKLLSKELNITIVLLAQLNRNLENRDDKRPLLMDLRQSGNLEEDPDIVAFLYRDKMYNPETKFPNRMEFIIRKHRNGPIGTINLKFEEATTNIEKG